MNDFEFDEILTRMKRRYFEISGVRVTEVSDVGIRFRVIAFMFADIVKRLNETRHEMSFLTAGAHHLDSYGEVFGCKREGKPAKGYLRFFKATEMINEIVLPAGIAVRARGHELLRYITTEEKQLDRETPFVDVAAVAESCGEEFNLEGDQIGTLCEGIDGIVEVKNVERFEGGVQKENDTSFRERIIAKIRKSVDGEMREADA
ncbi:MAG: baseplate J/gp47 family protein [Oscillospiraceae bacterium]|jgi:uncharacterized phage protein gp47/JayE|nr:baseplate J/gp47 family protein [Oscillospiraceae bacterium]